MTINEQLQDWTNFYTAVARGARVRGCLGLVGVARSPAVKK
jgi:hypothetical protein